MFNTFKKTQTNQSANEIGFEVHERQTPIAGYILLIFMIIISFWLGISALGDLEDVPTKPQRLSTCAGPFIVYGWQDAWRYSGDYYDYQVTPAYQTDLKGGYVKPDPSVPACIYSVFEQNHGVDKLFAESSSVRSQISSLDRQIVEKQNNEFTVDAQVRDFRSAYDLALAEKTAQVQGKIYNIDELQSKLTQLETQKTQLEKEIEDLKSQSSALSQSLEPSNQKLQSAYKLVLKDWRTAWRWYELWVFLLQVLFAFPFFFAVYFAYLRLSARNSPYTIILSFLLFTASALVAKIICVYFWSLFLAFIIQKLWELIQYSHFLKSLISYLGMFVSIGIFGGAVYFLQKKIFNPARVALRRLRDNKCPNCQFSLKLAKNFCPNCGEKILEQCSKCGQLKYTKMPTCPHCGSL